MQHLNGRPRTAIRRSVATAVTVALGAGLVTAVAPAATATTSQGITAGEAVLPPQNPVLPDHITLHEAGPTGYSASLPGSNNRFWTDFATGETRSIGNQGGHSGLYAAQTTAPDGTRAVTVTDHATGGKTLHSLPQDTHYAGVFTQDAIVVYRRDAAQYLTSMSILRRAADGTTEEIAVTGVPENSRHPGYRWLGQTGFGAVVAIWSRAGVQSNWYLDYATARLTRLPETGPDGYRLGRHHVITALDQRARKVTTLDTRTPDAAPVVTDLPAPESFESGSATVAVVGDSLLVSRKGNSYRQLTRPGTKLLAVPIGNTGEPRELLPYATGEFAPAPDGSVLLTGGTGPKDWAVRRVTAAADGTLETTVARGIPKTVASIEGLAIGGGRLSYAVHTDGAPLRAVYSHDLSATDTGTPVIGARQAPAELLSPIKGDLHSPGDGRSAFVNQAGMQVVEPGHSARQDELGTPPSLSEATGRYFILTDGDYPHWQYIQDRRTWSSGLLAHERPATAASVWGSTLWTPGKTVGNVVPFDLKTKTAGAELELGSGCVPDSLQTVGRWLYWSCGITKAGVYDRTAAKNLPVTAGGKAKLGDGFVVREDAGQLALTNLHTGVTAPVATVPANAKWAVDKFGGHLAYVDAEQAIRVRTVDVPRSPVALIESGDDPSQLVNAPQSRRWEGRWQLSRPAGSWSITVKDAAGHVVRTLAQNSIPQTGAQLAAAWDTKDSAGRTVRNGKYGLTLTVDGRVATSQWITVSGGPDVPRDYLADGIPEVVTRLGSDLVAHQGLTKAATGGAVQRVSKGWKNITAVLPMGDMNNQRCDDLVVRNTAGELWRYEGACAGLPGPTSTKVRIGIGFAGFDTILPAGDLTGDGQGDLLGRKPDGKLYLYAVTPTGTLRSAGILSGSFKGLTLIAPGDLNGDGHGDLLARDAGGELWRFNGTGKKTLGARTLVQKDWAVTSKTFAGTGDLNGDGHADLVSRDTSGRLWQHLGTGKGTLSAPAQVGTGWQRYTSLH
ncbi:FG-GAP-like repeat-containing protein [Streptomyces tsukubensis]|uniref:FG-GAP-like repeat-containing protein n=1 Tax=Streptomyces tsukubensis TaxID=83656 RepID=UPI00344E373F